MSSSSEGALFSRADAWQRTRALCGTDRALRAGPGRPTGLARARLTPVTGRTKVRDEICVAAIALLSVTSAVFSAAKASLAVWVLGANAAGAVAKRCSRARTSRALRKVRVVGLVIRRSSLTVGGRDGGTGGRVASSDCHPSWRFARFADKGAPCRSPATTGCADYRGAESGRVSAPSQHRRCEWPLHQGAVLTFAAAPVQPHCDGCGGTP